MLYANSVSGYRRSILLILQGMDTAGKGGIVKHVVGAANPQGIRYASFGKPTEEELAHHYLWRIRKKLPPAGHIGVFDRSHYEDVLIVRVHDLVPPDVWEGRYDEINAFEKELADGGTTIIKVAMFVSLDEQKRRLEARLDRPDKYWKFNPADIDERLLWPKYQEAYQAVLDRTSTDYAPWHVIPRRQQVVQPAGDHRAVDRSAQQVQSVVAAGRFRRQRREEAPRQGLTDAETATFTAEIIDFYRTVVVSAPESTT